MNTNRGIFESLPSQAGNPKDSPFAVAGDTDGGAIKDSPFAMADKPSSPFAVADDAGASKAGDFGKAAKLPERKKIDSPFQVGEPSEGFGFEAPASAAKPFDVAATAPSYPPFSGSAGADKTSPFSSAPQFPAPVSPAFGVPAAGIAGDVGDFMTDASSIRQLELRAIFSVDRELSADEILQRTRALPGIRSLARVGPKELVTIEGLKNLLPGLGITTGPLKILAGNAPLEFIRDGSVVLAVQTDGGYAPGVRETLMIVARELGRI